MRELSSPSTIFYKFVFPTLWIGAFVLMTIFMFLVPESFERIAAVRMIRWYFAGVTAIGGSAVYWACARIKKVSLDADTLLISNYRQTLAVPLCDVEKVSGSLFVNPELIWLHLRHPTPMGKKIVFMPPVRMFRGFSRHPLLAELRALIAEAAQQA